MPPLPLAPFAVLGLALAVTPAFADGPSFDCTGAESGAEMVFCVDADFAALDGEMARLYALAGAKPDLSDEARATLTADQDGWIEGRTECWKSDELASCIAASYAMRIDELRRGGADDAGDSPEAISFGPVAYTCDGFDDAVSATFINGRLSHAWLRWGENGALVTEATAASGARYTGADNEGAIEFWTKGDTALLTLPGQEMVECAVAPAD